MKNLVQELAASHEDWLSHLENDLKISAARDGDLVSLKYNQIESPMHEPIVQQCRGMVVDVKRRQTIAWPYNKFWNYGEALADPIDWATARVQEKLDGSLMILHVRDGIWSVASSGHPTAGGSFGADTRTFRDAFWSVMSSQEIDTDALDSRATYMLELCDAPNRVVVRHEAPRLVLHGARWLEDGAEFTPMELHNAGNAAGLEVVREFGLGSIEQCLAAADALDPLKQEGFVVVDAEFRRVKIKSPRYVTLHHLKGEATPRRSIELWQSGEAGELLVHFPEFRLIVEPIHDKLDELARRAAFEHEQAIKCTTDRKGYASLAVQLPFSAVMFRMLTDGTSSTDDAKSIMRRMSLQALERMLEAESIR
ncbi:MAG TPA: RNA ligase [Kofleriaceae bacterium]|nr:RNA ligase [Kofleriaceae bacterium]